MKTKKYITFAFMQVTAQTIADIIQGEIVGDSSASVTAPSKIEEAKSGSFTFLGNEKYEHFIYETEATIVLVSKDFKPKKPLSTTLIKVDNVYGALSVLLNHFSKGLSYDLKISSLASIDDSAKIGHNTSIGDFSIIKKGVKIGNKCILHGQNYIGDNTVIGNHVVLYPGVKIYHQCVIGDHVIIHSNTVIGSDGFGFVSNTDGNYNKISQVGNVIIGENVEIGANSVIDRATMGSTVIEKGVKLDNLIQIAHNVIVGNNSVIAAQTGIAGSTKIGPNCMIGGQVGIVGHIEIAEGAMIQAKTGVSSSVKEKNSKLYGYPAMDYQSYLKSYAYFKKFPEIVSQLRLLEKEIDKVKQNG